MRKFYEKLLSKEESRSGSGIPRNSFIIRRKTSEAMKRLPKALLAFVFLTIGLLGTIWLKNKNG